MEPDRRPWGVLALVLFVLAALGHRALTREEPWIAGPEPVAETPQLVPFEPREPALRALLAGEGLDPNTASDEALQQLPGIGPALAARIRQARELAPFRTPRDLTRVRGLGPKSVARLAPFLRFER